MVPIVSAITVRRSAILPGTAGAEDNLVLDLSSVALMKEGTVSDLAQAAIHGKAARVMNGHHGESVMKVVNTGTETTLREARKLDRDGQAHAAPNAGYHVNSVTQEIEAEAPLPV